MFFEVFERGLVHNLVFSTRSGGCHPVCNVLIHWKVLVTPVFYKNSVLPVARILFFLFDLGCTHRTRLFQVIHHALGLVLGPKRPRIVHVHGLEHAKYGRDAAPHRLRDVPVGHFLLIEHRDDVVPVTALVPNQPELLFFVLAAQFEVIAPPLRLVHRERGALYRLQGRHTSHQTGRHR